MGIFDIFGTNNSPFGDVGAGAPSIGGVAADLTSVDNIVNGGAKATDYGRGVGGAIGAYFGQPQAGADIGAAVTPFLNEQVKPAVVDGWHSLWDEISK